MTFDQAAISAILVSTLALFVWGRWRHDVVAVLSLMAAVGVGIIAPDDAFVGFGNTAVVTVAAVLAISHALGRSGMIDLIGGRVMTLVQSPSAQRASLCLLGAFLSGFMNNVGALALLMPVAISAAKASGHSSSRMLMPLSFATLLGGMLTLIGTPPNLLISQFRAQAVGEPYGMFDFAPVGLAVALAGVAYIVTVGWRLIPEDRSGRGCGGGELRGHGLRHRAACRREECDHRQDRRRDRTGDGRGHHRHRHRAGRAPADRPSALRGRPGR